MFKKLSLGVAALLAAGAASAQDTDRAREIEAWRSDAVALHDDLVTNHPAPFAYAGPEAFASARDAIVASAPTLDWPQYVVEMGRMISLLRDGHSNIFPPGLKGAGFQGAYPVQLFLFSDGVYATLIGQGLEQIAGKRVVAINGVAAEEAFARMAAGGGADNPVRNIWVASLGMMSPGIVYGGGLGAEPEAPLRLTFEDGEDGTSELEVAPLPWNRLDPRRMGNAFALAAPDSSLPLPFDQGPNIEMRRIADGKALLVVYRAVSNEGPQSIADFARGLEAELTDRSIERLIFDIRANGGGNNQLNQPLVHAVIRATHLNRPGKLFVLTGRNTFSAAVNFATAMESETQALFVGEPTGGAPNHSGDADQFSLPATGFTYTRSTLLWQDSSPLDDRPWILPDIPAPPSFAAFLAGRDPALEAALSYAGSDDPPAPPVTRWTRESQQREWRLPD